MTIDAPVPADVAKSAPEPNPVPASLGFDWLISLLTAWFGGGVYLDGWAHAHGRVDNTFFTPWHAVLYSGFLAAAIALVVAVVRNHARGYAWRQALPPGYALSLLGVPIFLVAGIADLIWHTLFGFEIGVEPLLSPPHLALALGGLLMVTGPIRSCMRRPDPSPSGLGQRWLRLGPALLSLTIAYSIFTFFTEYAHPFESLWAAASDFYYVNLGRGIGVASILLQSAILMGFVLLAVRRWQLPFGAFTLLFTVNAALLSALADHHWVILVALPAGLIADLLVLALRPSVARVRELRVFAFAVPFALYLLYFLALQLGHGLIWSIHLWMGSAILAGVVGLMLTYLVAPPVSAA